MMSSTIDDFQSNLEVLPYTLQKKYSLLRNLDESLQEVMKQNGQRCEQEIEDIKRQVKSGNTKTDQPRMKFSNEALEEQKHSISIADEKVALASQAYDLVDAQVQQLDQYLKDNGIELQRVTEKETALPAGARDPNADSNNTKFGRVAEGSRGGRKKTRLATAATTAPSNPTSMDLDLPVDPNEPTYCYCNQVSYGEMVACDQADCSVEWFHFGCVGLKEKPKGKWYCPDCAGTKRRKGK